MAVGRAEEGRSADATVHVTVCICTFRRQMCLRRLLLDLRELVTDGLFTFSIVVADNDEDSGQGGGAGRRFAQRFREYCVEPRQNIALARNKAVENSTGDFLAFIDDDEFPIQSWLLTLSRPAKSMTWRACWDPSSPTSTKSRRSGLSRESSTTGPLTQRVSDRLAEGADWECTAEATPFAGETPPFRPEFLSGEDQDFFRRMIDKGHVLSGAMRRSRTRSFLQCAGSELL